jgi:hypothetical protein
MFTTFNNNSEMINNTLQMECVTIKLFGLTTKILINDFVMFILGLVVTIIFADMLANYMFTNIDDQKKKKDEFLKQKEEISALSSEIKRLNEEINGLKKPRSPGKTIIQCNKCYNEYCETEIKSCKIIGHIYQQYCINCYYSKNMRKSQSDTKLNYQ